MRSVKKSRRTSNNLSRRRDKGRRDKRRKTRKKSTKRKSTRRRRTRRRIKHMMRGGAEKVSATIKFNGNISNIGKVVGGGVFEAAEIIPTPEFLEAFREAMSAALGGLVARKEVVFIDKVVATKGSAVVYWHVLVPDLPAMTAAEPAEPAAAQADPEEMRMAEQQRQQQHQKGAEGRAIMAEMQKLKSGEKVETIVVDTGTDTFTAEATSIQVFGADALLKRIEEAKAKKDVALQDVANSSRWSDKRKAAKAKLAAAESDIKMWENYQQTQEKARQERQTTVEEEGAQAILPPDTSMDIAVNTNLKDYFEDDVKKLQNISDPEVLRNTTLQTDPDARYKFAMQTTRALELLSEKMKEVIVPPNIQNTEIYDKIQRLGYAKKVFHRLRMIDSILLLNLSPQFNYFLTELSELLGDKVLSHYAGGLVANGFSQWFMKSEEQRISVNKTLFRVIYETLKAVLSQLESMVDTFDLMMARIIQESKPFLQVQQLAQEGISALTLGGSLGADVQLGPAGGIGGTASIPNVPVGMWAADALRTTEYQSSHIWPDTARKNFNAALEPAIGTGVTKHLGKAAMDLKSFVDHAPLTDKFSPEAVNFNTYFKNLRDLLFSQAATVSKYLYNLEIINNSVKFKRYPGAPQELPGLWESYKTMGEANRDMYDIITKLCRKCKTSINDNIEENIEKRMDLLMAHPPLQQTFRRTDGPFFNHQKVFANMLPPHSISQSVGDSKDSSVSASESSQFDYSKGGEPVLEGEGKGKSTGRSEGHNTSSSTNVVDVPDAFEEHLRLKSRADFDEVNAKVTKAQQQHGAEVEESLAAEPGPLPPDNRNQQPLPDDE